MGRVFRWLWDIRVWLAGLAMIAALAGLGLYLPEYIVDRDLGAREQDLSAAELADAVGGTRAALLQAIGGAAIALGVLVTWWQFRETRERNEKELRLSRDAQLTDRFYKAVEGLGSKNLDLRIGGIHALERIAADSERDRAAILELLSAWCQRQRPYPPKYKGWEAEDALRVRAPDLQMALDVLTRFPVPPDRYVRLFLAQLTRASFMGAVLRKADLRRAYMERADLRDADLRGAHLDGAYLGGSNLSGADLRDVTSPDANFEGAVTDERTQMSDDLKNDHFRTDGGKT